MKRKVIIIFILIVVCILFLMGFYLLNYSQKNKINEKEDNTGIGYDLSGETGWSYKLYLYGLQETQKLFPEDYQFNFDKDNKIIFNLNDLAEKGMNISPFNTNTIHCDKEKTYVIFEYNETYTTKNHTTSAFNLSCTKD